MQDIITLGSGLKIGIIGNIANILFDDNTIVHAKSSNESEIIFNPYNKQFVYINNIPIEVGTGTLEITDWVKFDIDKLVLKLHNNDIHILICTCSIIHLVYKYMHDFYPTIPIYIPHIIDTEGDYPVVKINSFFIYKPNYI